MSRLLPVASLPARLVWGLAAALTLANLALNAAGHVAGPVFYSLLAVTAVTCAWRARVETGGRAIWVLITIGVVTWLGAELSYDFHYVNTDIYPSPADGLWLVYYPLVAAALALMLRQRIGSVPRIFWLDLAIGTAAVAAVVITTTFEPALNGTAGLGFAAVAVNAAYPAGDLLLMLMVVAAIVLGGGSWNALWGWLAASFLAYLVTDSLYLQMLASGTWTDGSLAGAGWPLAAIMISTAAWQRDRSVSRARRWSRLLPPSAFGMLGLAVLVWDHFDRVHLAALVMSAVAMALVIVRFAGVFRENLRLIDVKHEEARTDALTGLGNRRALLTDLAAAGDDREKTVLALYDLDGFKKYNDTFGHPAGDELLRRLGARLSVMASEAGGEAYRLGGDEFCLLAPLAGSGAAALSERGSRSLTEHGDGFAVGASAGFVVLPCVGGADAALRDADRLMYAAKHGRRPSGAQQAVDALLAAVRERHPDLGAHGDGVADLASAVAERLGLSAPEAECVRAAAELHDIGKIAIPDAILAKPGPLTDEEWRFMHRHTVIGERILLAAFDLQEVAPLVRASHERWDGGGYPDRIAGEEIPLGARIVSACDAYDAMVGPRPYRGAMDRDEAIAELRRCAGSQFDPAVAAALAEVLEQVPSVA